MALNLQRLIVKRQKIYEAWHITRRWPSEWSYFILTASYSLKLAADSFLKKKYF